MRPQRKDMVILRRLRWYHRLWHTTLLLFGKESYACVVFENKDKYHLELEQAWLCRGCMKYVDFDHGCDNEDPKLAGLCDDCYVKRGHDVA